eukprot:136620_1
MSKISTLSQYIAIYVFIVFIFHIYGDDSSDDAHDSPNKIAVIGAGVSSLYMVLKLHEEFGVTDVDIYERESQASANIFSYDTKGEYGFHDLGLTFPPRYFNDSEIPFGLSDTYFSLLTRYHDITIQSGPLVSGLLTTTQQYIPTQSFLQNGIITDFNALASETLQLLLIIQEFTENGYTNIVDWYENGFTIKGESFDDWSARKNLNNVAYFSKAVTQSFFPLWTITEWTASFMLHYNRAWYIEVYISLLLEFGLTSSSVRNLGQQYSLIANVMEYQENNAVERIIVRPSYQQLFDNVASELTNNGINIKFNTEITKVQKHKGKLELTFQQENNDNEHDSDDEQHSELYDYVFISSSARDTIQFLNSQDFEHRYNLLAKYTMTQQASYSRIKDTFMVRKPSFLTDGLFGFYPQLFAIGTTQLEQLYDNCSPLYLRVFNDAQTVITLGLGPKWQIMDAINVDLDEFSEDCVQIAVHYLNNALNMTLDEKNMQNLWTFQHATSVTSDGEVNNFYELFDELQGDNGLFFIGETVSGVSVPLIIEHIENRYQLFYDIMTRNADKSSGSDSDSDEEMTSALKGDLHYDVIQDESINSIKIIVYISGNTVVNACGIFVCVIIVIEVLAIMFWNRNKMIDCFFI